ncbi:MAG: zinc ribbon domain-containing protein [Chloroflexota bacterium]|nr:zinc ribbon domain-containing protein [Chloroflexota bacterium]
MPTYSYRGTACTHEFDYVQKFSDDPLTECIECQGPVRRVYQPVGVVFKGSGWYINDSRKTDTGNGKKDGDSPTSNGKKDGGDAAPGTPDTSAKGAAPKADAPAKAPAS